MAFRVIYLFESRPKLAVRIIGHSFTTADAGFYFSQIMMIDYVDEFLKS